MQVIMSRTGACCSCCARCASPSRVRNGHSHTHALSRHRCQGGMLSRPRCPAVTPVRRVEPVRDAGRLHCASPTGGPRHHHHHRAAGAHASRPAARKPQQQLLLRRARGPWPGGASPDLCSPGTFLATTQASVVQTVHLCTAVRARQTTAHTRARVRAAAPAACRMRCAAVRPARGCWRRGRPARSRPPPLLLTAAAHSSSFSGSSSSASFSSSFLPAFLGSSNLDLAFFLMNLVSA